MITVQREANVGEEAVGCDNCNARPKELTNIKASQEDGNIFDTNDLLFCKTCTKMLFRQLKGLVTSWESSAKSQS